MPHMGNRNSLANLRKGKGIHDLKRFERDLPQGISKQRSRYRVRVGVAFFDKAFDTLREAVKIRAKEVKNYEVFHATRSHSEC